MMDHANPSSFSTRTLGDFLPEALQEAGGDRDSAPPLNDNHFPRLGGGRGGTGSHGQGDRRQRSHRSRSRRPETRTHRSRSRVHKPPTSASVAEKPATWAERCTTSKTKEWSPRALSFFELAIKNGVKIAVCPPEEMAKAMAYWDRVLMGYFVGLKPFVPMLARYFKQLWRTKGGIYRCCLEEMGSSSSSLPMMVINKELWRMDCGL